MTPTPRQLELLRMIANGLRTHRAIASAMGIRSTNGVADHLLKLRNHGFVLPVPASSRTGHRGRHTGPQVPPMLTDKGWRALGPCDCINLAARAGDILVRSGAYSVHIGTTPFKFCPWCGRKLPSPEPP